MEISIHHGRGEWQTVDKLEDIPKGARTVRIHAHGERVEFAQLNNICAVTLDLYGAVLCDTYVDGMMHQNASLYGHEITLSNVRDETAFGLNCYANRLNMLYSYSPRIDVRCDYLMMAGNRIRFVSGRCHIVECESLDNMDADFHADYIKVGKSQQPFVLYSFHNPNLSIHRTRVVNTGTKLVLHVGCQSAPLELIWRTDEEILAELKDRVLESEGQVTSRNAQVFMEYVLPQLRDHFGNTYQPDYQSGFCAELMR